MLFYVFGTNSRHLCCNISTKVLHRSFSASYRLLGHGNKDARGPLPTKPRPESVEYGWYDWWREQNLFSPHDGGEGCGKFVMCLPPPNVTGTLHLGHALGSSIQDALARWQRMCGSETVWVPGSDHAGIATQVVVEKHIHRELGLTTRDIGREAFLQHVWDWKHQKGGVILDQMRRLGFSLDWKRETFTLDEKLSVAVQEAFIRLHDEGLIYRSQKLVNWCCALKSAISDIEVEKLELDGKTYLTVPGHVDKVACGLMWTIQYPTLDGGSVEVSTTRPETMLGDVGVAVHPEDPRYTHLHGSSILHPLTGDRIPVVLDHSVQRDFGTGVVKLTPGHDQTDYDISQRHGLPLCNILSDDGIILCENKHIPQGLSRFEAREKVLSFLSDQQRLIQVDDHKMVLPICSRTGDIIEPLLKDQWFVNCDHMAQQAIQAVTSGDLKLIPEHYEKQWCDWLENIRDWCISRQIWWGHQIPAYRVTNSQTAEELGWVSAHNMEQATTKACTLYGLPASQLTLLQDEDVLDTWFSSALLPFSVFGWPQQTPDLSQYYPTDTLVTASDIMFFWVARMVMMGDKLTGKLPFNTVLFHSILRDSTGRKMSKSLGNVIDPMDVINGITLQELNTKLELSNLSPSEIKKAKKAQKADFPDGIAACGADSLRFTLLSYNFKSQYINVDMDHVVESYQLCNKLWQGARFILDRLPDGFTPSSIQECNLSPMEAWILSRLSDLVHVCQEGFTNYDLYRVTARLEHFWWHDVCDLFLEYSKTSSPTASLYPVLHRITSTYLRCLAPIMPYISEELYQRLPGHDGSSIHVQPYPSPQSYSWRDVGLEEEIQTIRDLITQLRALQQEFSLKNPSVYISSDDETSSAHLATHCVMLEQLTRCQCVSDVYLPPGECVTRRSGKFTIQLDVKESLDCDQEISRIDKQKVKLEKSLEKFRKKTVKGVPDHIAQEALKKIGEIEETLTKLEETLKVLHKSRR